MDSTAKQYLAEVAQEISQNTPVDNQLLFSILVPVYNQAHYLPEALDSLINQTYDNWEAIVVNDGSTDETPEVMKRYAEKDSRIRIFHKENGGCASALNEGLRNVQGEWICWLSSDDLFEPEKLSVHLQAIKQKPEIKFFHTYFYHLDDETGVKTPIQLDLNESIPPIELEVLRFFRMNYPNGISIAIHREVFEHMGYFNEKYRYGQDFDMWLRISAHYKSLFINHRTCVTRRYPEQISNKFPLKGYYDSARACLEFLNKHKFPALFPFLDLSIAKQALFAINKTLLVLTKPSSVINLCGYGPALADRLCEWLTQSAQMELKSALKPQITKINNSAQKTKLSEEIKAALQSMTESLDKPFQYNSYNPLTEIARHIVRLENNGRTKDAFTLKRYLDEVRSFDHPEEKNQLYLNNKENRKLTDKVVPPAETRESNYGEQDSDCKPKFSIVMTNYNHEKHIAQAIESVLNQTFKDWELIIVEDCSTDNSLQIIKRYLKDKRIRLIQNSRNHGLSAAQKIGVENVRSEYFGTLDSDDALVPHAIETMYTYHVKYPDCGLIYSQHMDCDENLTPKKTGYCAEIPSSMTNLEANVVSHFRTFKMRDYLKTSGYDVELTCAEDKDIIYKMEEVTQLKFVNECLYLYRDLPNSISHDVRRWWGNQAALNKAKGMAHKRRWCMSEGNSVKVELQKEVQANFKIGMAVLAHERPEYLEICLDTLFQTKLYDYDITFLLQDDGSKDPRVREIIERKRDPKYKIIRYFTPKGPNCAGAAINKATRRLMEIDDFDIIGWCDPDALFHPEWLNETMKTCLWAKKNHKDHILGPFSSFNSSDFKFHKILGAYSSPFGKYVVKRQMGMLNCFYFKEDFLKLGFFAENKDDETLMTLKFVALGVRNFCTETSYVEHIGQFSILNQWRPTPVYFGTYAMNLVKTGWPSILGKVGTMGYFKHVHQNISLESDAHSNTKIDILIPVVEKDLDILPFVIDGARENLKHPIGRIIIVAPESDKIKSVCSAKACEFISEDTVLPISKKYLTYVVDGVDRSGWLFQQLIKLAGDSICSQEHYLALDADTVLIHPQVFKINGKIVLLHSDEHHQPYFDLYRKLFGVETKTALSFVSHQMLFRKALVREFKRCLEEHHGINWIEALLKNMDDSQTSGMSEYELYGQWLLANHPDKITREYWFNVSVNTSGSTLAQHQMYKMLPQLKAKLNNFCRSISFHSYNRNDPAQMSLMQLAPVQVVNQAETMETKNISHEKNIPCGMQILGTVTEAPVRQDMRAERRKKVVKSKVKSKF